MTSKRITRLAAVLTGTWLCFGSARAQNAVDDALVKGQLYIWNRLADLFEIVRPGIAVGPSLGAEVAVTEYAQLGAYAANEKGLSLSLLPPVAALDGGEQTVAHRGLYKTAVIGPTRRWENTGLEDVRFRRAPADTRVQLALGLVHLYLNVDSHQAGDFFGGIFGEDWLGDDHEPDPNARREPARQLGRGIMNIITGVAEIPLNIGRVNRERGDFAGASVGLIEGVWRFVQRECVGALEIVTFPMGWKPIIEPEFMFEPGRSTDWRLNQPAFRKQY